MKINLDFETRSRVDLTTAGLYNYASDRSTDVICMAYSVDDGPVELWLPGDDVPEAFRQADTFYAWNAEFERLIHRFVMTQEYGFPLIRLSQWRCTAYQARCSNMPAALGNAARCLRVPHQKHADGKMLIKMLCQPQPSGLFCTDPALLERMYEYCKQDVRTELAVAAQLRPLTRVELDDYVVQCRINDRGVMIDTELCAAAQRYATAEERELVGRIEELTDGVVTKARGEGLKEWVVERLTAEQQKLVKNRDGKVSLDRYNRSRLLDDETIDPVVREVVESSDFAQRSSVGKFKAMLHLAGEDDRLRGAILVNGAPESGRYSSKGAQIHNFPRNTLPNPEEARADLVDGIIPEDITSYFKMPMMTLLSRLLRSALIPAPGHKFLVSDWSAIEGRVAPWLCRDEKKLELYRTGAPIYELAASSTFGVPVEKVTPDQRQVGKVCLAAGTLVVTDAGVLPIEEVTTDHKVWDGVEWVAHAGLADNGVKQCVTLNGMKLTPDHQVYCGPSMAWIPAEQVVSNERMNCRALETAMGCLPSQDIWPHGAGVSGRSSFSAIAGARNTGSRSVTCYEAVVYGARRALLSILPPSASNICTIPPRARTSNIAGDCSIVSRRSRSGATTRSRNSTCPMEGGASGAGGSMNTAMKLLAGLLGPAQFARCGGSLRCSRIFARCRAGISRSCNWIGSTLRKAMRRVTCASRPMPSTAGTRPARATCTSASSSWNRVYDIVNAGPRRRFMVVTARGPMIVHNCELSFQYQGGKAAFLAMARAYGVKATAEEADKYKGAWRTANPWAPMMWADIETAVRRALATPKELHPVGRLTYFAARGILAGGTTLFCQLPCGRVLTYPDVRKSHEDGPYGVQEVLTALRPGYTPKASEKDWPRVSLYGGKLFNNAVQGTAASLLRHALRECQHADLRVVLHLHDEICVESAKRGDKTLLEQIMNTAPEWAKGLPLAADVVELDRYGNH